MTKTGYKAHFGCQGCTAYTGNGCIIADGSGDPSVEYMPAWERNNHGPYDSITGKKFKS